MGGPGIIDGEEHEETNNFLECHFIIDNISYVSSENYFQCAKTSNKADFEKIKQSGAGKTVWEAGSKITLRDDWEKIKVDIMYIANYAKIHQNPDLAKRLACTNGSISFIHSSDFWNYWNSRIFERIRAEIRQNEEQDLKIAAEIKAQMEEYKVSH